MRKLRNTLGPKGWLSVEPFPVSFSLRMGVCIADSACLVCMEFLPSATQNQVCWHQPVIQALGREKQKDPEIQGHPQLAS